MSEETLSIADRWMHRYEQAHPEVLLRVTRQGHQKAHSPSMSADPTSMPLEYQGYASPWKTFSDQPEKSTPEPVAVKSGADAIVWAARQTRLALGLSQTQFARALGISPRTLGEWEQRRRSPSAAARQLLRWAIQNPEHLF